MRFTPRTSHNPETAETVSMTTRKDIGNAFRFVGLLYMISSLIVLHLLVGVGAYIAMENKQMAESVRNSAPEIKTGLFGDNRELSIEQGDVIQWMNGEYVEKNGSKTFDGNIVMCTAGMVDELTRSMVTAAHCVGEVGSAVRDQAGNEIGTVTWRGRGVGSTAPDTKDVAVVYISPEVEMGHNKYSQHTSMLSPAQVSVGDTLCRYGIKANRVVCSTVSRKMNNNLSLSPDDSISGDSGGPIWSPSRGFVGVLSAGSKDNLKDDLLGRHYTNISYTGTHEVKKAMVNAETTVIEMDWKNNTGLEKVPDGPLN